MKIVKQSQGRKTYQADGFKIYYIDKGITAGDNKVNLKEEIYLITGTAEFTLEEKVWIVNFPGKVVFPAKTYHKIKAITDISLIILKS